MQITDKMEKEDDLKYHSRNLKEELRFSGYWLKDRNITTNCDLRYYAWLFRKAYKEILGEQE